MGETEHAGVRRQVFGKFVLLTKAWYAIKARYRHLRISRPITRLFGPQYLRSRDRVEIDITYACNLRCNNCNRSISQAPEKLHMSLDTVRDFVRESIARGKRWKAIRVLGGEPTLHPQFFSILDELQKYTDWNPHCVVQLVSNGHGKAVKAKLAKIPDGIVLENSAKVGNIQPDFGAFNLAPVDDPAYARADYSNGCAVMKECGMGLSPLGYYPCAVAAGIDRIAGKGLGMATLPEDKDNMTAVSQELCRLCGHFREGHFIPGGLRPPMLTQQMSPTWAAMYERWRKNKRAARRNDAPEMARASKRYPTHVIAKETEAQP